MAEYYSKNKTHKGSTINTVAGEEIFEDLNQQEQEVSTVIDEIKAVLANSGMLRTADRLSLQMLLNTARLYRQVVLELSEAELTFMNDKGDTKINPLLPQFSTLSKQYQQQLSAFGLTPISRAKFIQSDGGKGANEKSYEEQFAFVLESVANGSKK